MPSDLAKRSQLMQFILTGFTQDREFRVFAFEGINSDRVRTPFTVRADLALSRTYGIRLQELPLMCRAILERREEDPEEVNSPNALTFTEDAMRLHASNCIAARALAAQKKKAPRRPANETNGAAWRSPQP
jgi:hypothetical protein